MGTSIDAELLYGFGAAAESEELERLRDKLLELVRGDDGDTVEVRELLEEADDVNEGLAWLIRREELGLLETTFVGHLDWATGAFVYATSRYIVSEAGALARVESLMQTGTETELQEYAQLVKLAQLLDVDPSSIGWHLIATAG